MPCKSCIKRQSKYKAGEAIEIVTGAMRDDRIKYSQDVLQRYRGSTASLEYIKRYGPKGFSKHDLSTAKNVWTEQSFYNDKNDKYVKKRDAKK